MKGNFHVRFLGEGTRGNTLPLPDKQETEVSPFLAEVDTNLQTIGHGVSSLKNAGNLGLAVQLGAPALAGAASLRPISPHKPIVPRMPRRDGLRAATSQHGGGRGIVRGQTLIPSETGSQTDPDVTCIWSVQVRQEGVDLPGRPAVRPVPNCLYCCRGTHLGKSKLHPYFI